MQLAAGSMLAHLVDVEILGLEDEEYQHYQNLGLHDWQSSLSRPSFEVRES